MEDRVSKLIAQWLNDGLATYTYRCLVWTDFAMRFANRTNPQGLGVYALAVEMSE
jgi:hypothetical protein